MRYEAGQIFEGRIALELTHDDDQNEKWRFLKSYEIAEDQESWGRVTYTIDDVLVGRKDTRLLVVLDFYTPEGKRMNAKRRFVKVWTKGTVTQRLKRYSMSLVAEHPSGLAA